MSIRAYGSVHEQWVELFDCYDPLEWRDRLMRLRKYDADDWMDIDESDLADMEMDDEWPLSEREQAIVAAIRTAIAARGDDYVYIVCFDDAEAPDTITIKPKRADWRREGF